MSGGVLCARTRSVLSHSARRHVLVGLRAGRSRPFSAASSDEPYVTVSTMDSGPRTVWPDENMGPFGPQDQRFQLPGNVGFDCHLEGVAEQKTNPVQRTVPDVLTAPSSTERHQFILAQFVNEFQGKPSPVFMKVHKAEQYFIHTETPTELQTETKTETDCSINSCPELLRKDLEMMFPSAPASSITVVTVTHRQSSSEEVAQPDSDQLLNTFVSGAKEMCLALWTAGYWADFIDPNTGTAFFASPLRESPSQSEDKQKEMRHLGFHIEVSGSCTVIRHVLKGTPLFTGTVFTNAPTNSTTIARLQGLLITTEDEE
ncbi:metabolism of cobalamin associated Da [Cynoglossus semilaevis]|uniref:Metabolism of cobalamin associated Da n=1 Tax=Cynoglossus semilaevis TaxID=244447 RepID=A0A3P8VHV1_CYNSE|nr:methylmalonic aciduria and homocystinuria type D homolog, mitochondrial-like [Cynoglossus semilaevis]